MCVRVHARACVHACVRACVHVCVRACMHACVCAGVQQDGADVARLLSGVYGSEDNMLQFSGEKVSI